MDKLLAVLEVISPIFAAVILGNLAKRKQLITAKGVEGFQQFVMKIGLPCVVFNSCLTAKMGVESLSSMALAVAFMLLSTLWAFRFGRKKYPYHNLPQLFCAKETGMLGIPLCILLFGADQAYRMGVLDLAQSVTAFPTIAILTASTGENPSPKEILRKVISSPLMICSMAGLCLNLSGIGGWMDRVGVGSILTACTSFLSQPVSALMLFSVGYNFSLGEGNRKPIFRLCGLHAAYFALAAGLIQLALLLIPGVDAATRWVMVLYCALPASYLAPSLGRSEEDYTVSSGVCSLLTVLCLAVFCILAAVVV